MTNKMTNKKALTYVLKNVKDLPADVKEKLEGMIAALDNKAASTKRKPTAKQTENEGFKAQILEFMRANPNHLYTCTEIGKAVPALNGLNNQRISALMRGLLDAGVVNKTTEKGKSLFSAIMVEIEGEGD